MTASTASVSGLVTGIDWDTTIQQLLAIEAQPINLLAQRKQSYETKLAMWQQLNTKLQALKTVASSYTDKDDFLAKLATSSDTNSVAATANGSAPVGSHVITSITSLARANNYVAGTGYASKDNTFGQGAGSFVINFADHPDGAQAITLTYGTDYSSTTTLGDFVDVINNHPDNDGFLQASIVNDGSGATPYKLVLTAVNSGTDHRITSITDTSTGLAMAQGLTAQDLVFNIDSINVTKNSNVVTDVLEGVTLTFLDDGITEDVNITIEKDIATTKSNINSLVNAYNDVKTLINTAASYDEENEILGPLLGDGNVSSVRSKLDAIVAGMIPGLSSSATYNSLGQIGIKTSDSNGLLTIDDDELSDAFDEDFDAVADLFCEKVTTDNQGVVFESRSSDTEAGAYQVVVNYDGSGTITSAYINGNEATVIGTLIQGKEGNPEEDFLLKFNWPGSGSQLTANLDLSDGAASQFDIEIEFMTNTALEEGEVYWATDSLNTSIENFEEQIERMEERLEQKEEMMRREFTQLELYISQLKSQSSYIQSMLTG